MCADSGSSAYFRENSRVALEAPVTLQIDAFSEPLTGNTGDISLGGMFIAMPKPPSVGTLVRFQLELGFPAQTVRGNAEVVWIRAQGQGPQKPAGIGLQFRYLEEEGEPALRAVVEKALEELGPEPEPAPPVKRPPHRPRPPRPAAIEPPVRARKKAQRKPSAKGKEVAGESKKRVIVLLAILTILFLLLLL